MQFSLANIIPIPIGAQREVIKRSRRLIPHVPTTTNSRKLGEGSFSEVYLAELPKNENRTVFEKVAIKVMRNNEEADIEILINMHLLDTYAANNMQPIFSPGYHGHYNISRKIVLVFALMQCSLIDYVTKNDDDVATIGYAIDILLAIHFMHTVAKIVVADVHPKNVLLVDNKALLADFGLSSFAENRPVYKQVRGTLLHLAPELLDELNSNDAASDIWALGLTYYYMITKKFPFSELDHLDSDDFADEVVNMVNPIQYEENDTTRHTLLTRLSLMACKPDRNIRPTAQHLLDTVHEEANGIAASLKRR